MQTTNKTPTLVKIRFSDLFFLCGTEAGRKLTHDFLSLYSNSTTEQDPRSSAQGSQYSLCLDDVYGYYFPH
ncbi:hypothetical protein RYX36_032960, partial [Vicia faba]